MSGLFSTFVTQPLYNGLVLLIDIFPFLDLGLIIVLFTIIVKFVLFPLSLKAVRAQRRLKEVEPEVKALQEKYKDDRQTQALKLMELYRERNIKPFSGFLLILIQLPIIFGLYYVILRSGLPVITPELLYSFIPFPPHEVSTEFLGIVDVTSKSIVLALLAGATQFVQTRLAMPFSKKEGAPETMQEQFARSMALQMKYVFPIIVIAISYSLGAAIAIYWTTSNIFHIFQEVYVRKVKHIDDQSAVAFDI